MNFFLLFFIKGNKIQVRCQSLIMDLPAKAAALNIKQFNGEHGCVSCFHPGEYRGDLHANIYPPIQVNIKYFKIQKEPG